MLLLLVLACHRPPEPVAAVATPPAPSIEAPPVPIAAPGSVEEDVPADVSYVVRANAGDLRLCYERELKADPSVAGRVDAEWTIASGRAVGVRVVENTTGNEPLAACVTEAIARWSFPPELEGEVAWPFLFRPRS
jgi:hypothetical protein